MKKINLYALGNQENFNYYIFDKKNEVIVLLGKIFADIFGFYLVFNEEYLNKKRKWEYREINFEKLRDYHNAVSESGKNKRVDIFYGDKKIFVTICCPQKLRLKFNEHLAKISKISKPKKKSRRVISKVIK